MPMIAELLPNADDLLALKPQELAGPLLEALCSLNDRDGDRHQGNFMLALDRYYGVGEGRYDEDIKRAFMEAWVWLERKALVAPDPNG